MTFVAALDRRVRRTFGEGWAVTDVAPLYAAGDPRAVAIVEETARWLGLGLASVSAVIDPEVIVVGGGVAGLGPGFLAAAGQEMAARLMPRAWEGRVPPLEPARLGEDAGLVGAALLASRRLSGCSRSRRSSLIASGLPSRSRPSSGTRRPWPE